MFCKNIDSCLNEIRSYLQGSNIGKCLVINSENYNELQDIRRRLEADQTIKCFYISKYCDLSSFPDIDKAIHHISIYSGKSVLIGLSQALMLQSKGELIDTIDYVLHKSFKGYTIILLDHCESILTGQINRDPRLKNRIILLNGDRSKLPKIEIINIKEDYDEFNCLPKNVEKSLFKTMESNDVDSTFGLLDKLERMTDSELDSRRTIRFFTNRTIKMFEYSEYTMIGIDSIYILLSQKYNEIARGTKQSYGTEKQWKWLANLLGDRGSLRELINEKIGDICHLSDIFTKIHNQNDVNLKWLLWIAMKVFGVQDNSYLSLVSDNCSKYSDLERELYFAITRKKISDNTFQKLYRERKNLLKSLNEDFNLARDYCDKVVGSKDGIYYLTDLTDVEKYSFMNMLHNYEYSVTERSQIIHNFSVNLGLYYQKYDFNEAVIKLGKEDGFRDEISAYFNNYRQQKIINKITAEHIDTVQRYAIDRPYNLILPRSKIVNELDKNNAQCFFFDALGVEYLSFIKAKCQQLGLLATVYIGHCELPSITSQNKEFLKYFADFKKIDELDEIKHDINKYNYEKCKLPIHLFDELNIIEEQLKNISSMLYRDEFEKAVIISDHGASRLCVLFNDENNDVIELDHPGEHNGRCCPTKTDPQLPYAAFENEYSILANYYRFKGSRRANVEVHGGATLEETLVPIIVISRRPVDLEITFEQSELTFKPHTVLELSMYSNHAIKDPKLRINNKFYSGKFTVDNKHIKFQLDGIRSKGTYEAEVYDGSQFLGKTHEFTIVKKTREQELF